MGGSFAAETAEYYAKFRRSYPDAIVDAVVDLLRLTSGDAVIDLGCGTGLLTRAVAGRVRVVVGVDPEADMLAAARRATGRELSSKVIWMLGSDADIPALGCLMSGRAIGAITIGQALHFMDHQKLFKQARRLLRTGGGLAVIANGTPLWQQDSEWSQALRTALEQWFQTTLTATCGTDRETIVRYAEALARSGYQIHEACHDYEDDLDLERVLGGLYSALSAEDVPADRRPAFTEYITQALPPVASFTETVRVTALIGVAD